MAADPEALYQEVLTEEQQKGVTPAVAEGRAKAARSRAEHGSPHPKEPKWWPGAQPHLEGGNGAAPETEEAPAEEETVEEAPVEEAPVAEAAAEAPAAEAPSTPEPAAAPESAPEPPTDPSTAPAEPAAATAPQPAAAATATEARPSGVTHGTPTGNRLRPEDAVTTDVQLDAQQAVYQRRKLIDDVVATGVPAVAAAAPASSRSQPFAFLVYIAVVVVAIAVLWGARDSLGTTEAPPHGNQSPAPDGGSGVSISAESLQFNTDTLEAPADEKFSIEFANNDASSVQHNVAIYEEQGGGDLFIGEVIPGGQTVTYEVPALPQGEYYFQCDVHPGMNGTVQVE